MKKKEEKTKNYVIVTIACITCFLFVATITSALNVFNSNNLNATTSSVNKASYSLSLVGQYDTSKSSPNTIQGSVGYNGKIYFSMSYNAGKAKEKGKYLSKTYFFNTKSDILEKKNISYEKYTAFDDFYRTNPTYKANDMTANVLEKKSGEKDLIIYSLAMDANHNLSKRNGSILLSYNISTNDYKEYSFKSTNANCKTKNVYNEKTKKYEKKDICDEFINIGYNASNDSFYSLLYQTGEIYNYKVKMPNKNSEEKIETKKICNIKPLYYNEKGERTYNKNEKSSNYSVSYQGITMKGYLMYVPFQKKKYIDKDNGKYSIINYLAVYDTRNCKKNSTINYSYVIRINSEKETKLDNAEYNKLSNYAKNTFELEDVFFMNSKLYLAYNAMRSKGISFYKLNFSDDVIKINNTSAKNDGNNVKLTAHVDAKYKIYAYKFCPTKDGTNCEYKGYTDDSGKKYLTLYEKKLEEIVKKTNSNTWYLFVRDLYGNTKVKPINISL